MLKEILKHVITLGIPAIIRAVAEVRRKRREQRDKRRREKHLYSEKSEDTTKN